MRATPSKPNQRIASVVTLVAIVLPPLSGCANWSYNALHIGQTPREYADVLPRTFTRDTGDDLCYYEEKRGQRFEAIIVNLGADRRVDGKWQAQRRVRKDWLGRESLMYGLRGEFDPTRVGLDEAAAADVLRFYLLALTEWHDDPQVIMARGMIATGVVRLLESWPEIDLSDLADDVDALQLLSVGGGTAKVAQDANGVFHFEYQESVARDAAAPAPTSQPVSE